MDEFANAIRKLLDDASLYADLLISSEGEIRARVELFGHRAMQLR